MDLIEVWHEILNGGTVTAEGISPKTATLLQNRASAYKAIECRRSKRAELLEREVGTYLLGHELYYHAAVYYRNNYLNGKKRAHPLDEETKPRCYRAKRYKKAIADAKAKYGEAPTDDAFIECLFSLMPQTAFTQDELDIWKRIYEYATERQVQYTATNRINRRTQEVITDTYLKFADWLLRNSDTYSSKDIHFVAKMTAYYDKKGITVSAKQADTFLRYYASREYFSDGDLTALGLDTPQKVNTFFGVLGAIKAARKK